MARDASWTLTVPHADSERLQRQGARVWCDDGKPACGAPRPCTAHTSTRLMFEGEGFLDITILATEPALLLDFNGARARIPCYDLDPPATPTIRSSRNVQFRLHRPSHGTFTIHWNLPICQEGCLPGLSGQHSFVESRFKLFPHVSSADVTLYHSMISKNFVPYQNPLDLRGKTNSEIAALGERLFPWSPHSYVLAMAANDWTTASFARVVLLQTFRYSALPGAPLDSSSIARMIWESDWGNFVPSNSIFMNTFMMKPATSLEDIARQLERVSAPLLRLASAENRLLAAALASLPRTCTRVRRRLYSGQPDIAQMGFERFLAEIHECPANAGPADAPLGMQDFEGALRTFMCPPDAVVTTKCPWSFTDVREEALSYANGIFLVLRPPRRRAPSSLDLSGYDCGADDGGELDEEEGDAAVWDGCAYVTPLSDGSEKREYVFPSESRFTVLKIERNPSISNVRYTIDLEVHSAEGEYQPPESRVSSADNEKDSWRESMETLVSDYRGKSMMDSERYLGVDEPGFEHCSGSCSYLCCHIQ